MKPKEFARTLALVLLVAPLAFTACGRGRAGVPTADETIPVRIADVKMETISPAIRATGILGLKDEVRLSFKIGGVIERIPVQEGDYVRAGQILALLDMREIDARVAQARSGLEKAERDLARAGRLYADSVATLQQLEDAQTGVEATRAAYDAIAFDRQHAAITAPADGVILGRMAEAGELVPPGKEILSFGSGARGSVVRVGLADRDAVRVKRGDPAIVRFDLNPPLELQGTVTEMAAASDPSTGTFRAEIALPGTATLVSGLVANVAIHPQDKRPLAVIPVDALIEANGMSATVFSLDGPAGRARRHAISIAFITGDQVAVASGLEDVAQVVTDGALRLNDGDEVRVKP